MSRDGGPDRSQRFQLIQPPLGCGTFGCVYRATDNKLPREVAIKIPHDEKKEAALIREAALMWRISELNEKHVVRLFDLHELNGRQVVVMEFVDGEPLRARVGDIGEQSPLRVRDAVRIAMQTAQGLSVLHNAFGGEGILHRDIKPDNIMLQAGEDVIKIADFGIARILESSGYASTTTGTLPYMSPELLQSRADTRADIYAAGVVLYEMVTGRLPFEPFDDSGDPKPPLVFGADICNGLAPQPREIVDISEELNDIILRAIAPDVDERYEHADELYEALASYDAEIGSTDLLAQAHEETDPVIEEKLLIKATRNFPCVDSFLALARFYTQKRNFRRALQVLRDGITQCDACERLLIKSAMIYRQPGKQQEAVEVLKRTAQEEQLDAGTRSLVERLLSAWGK